MLLRRIITCFVFIGILGTSPDLQAQQLLRRLKSDIRGVARAVAVRQKPPHSGKDGELEKLAKELDWLEAHIDKFGSVVAKQPDIWGESRLTKFRAEYENEMAGQLGQFKLLDNASITRQDVAAFASATGLSAAVNGAASTVNASVSGVVPDASIGSSPPLAGADGTINPAAINQTVSIATPAGSLAGTALTAATNLDVSEQLNQRSRYINHLQQLRRINSGDDTSDAPGYSLNLVRIPISITPGRETRRSHGAKVTITAKPFTSNTLLPETFRSLVINDVVDQLALPVLKLSESPSLEFFRRSLEFDARYGGVVERMKEFNQGIVSNSLEVSSIGQAMGQVYGQKEPSSDWKLAEQMASDAVENLTLHMQENGKTASQKARISAQIDGIKEGMLALKEMINGQKLFTSQTLQDFATGNQLFIEELTKDYKGIVGVNPVARRRRSSLPIPQVQISDVINWKVLVTIAWEFRESYKGQMVAWNQRDKAPSMHLPDVRHYLQSNMEGAYRMVSTTDNHQIVRNVVESGRGLATEIQEANWLGTKSARASFMSQIDPSSMQRGTRSTISPIMRSLAWPIVVEMALLNEQLNKDVHDIAVTRGDCGCHPTHKHRYYAPMPMNHQAEQMDGEFSAAAEEFQRYVECRWPIHVFHVDPVNEDQNVQAQSTISRQLAIAAAVGVASGNMNFRQANQFTRDYREQINTIGLNRTVSGFSHSNDTFGWSFRPRVQTHPNRGTLATFGETLIGRGPDANLRDAALEPGMRECTAIVLMPSFVPYCDFDVSTSWFRLDNPRSKEISNHQTMKLSRSIKYMQDCAVQCAECAHLYRDGETDRLLNRVQQLERELPLQSMRAQVPYENTLGGFELFSNGVTDLAPELVGWYGAPGVALGGDANCCAGNCPVTTPEGSSAAQATAPEFSQPAGTTLFLVGDNFSVHETQIIAGGIAIPRGHQTMISRQVIQITVPSCAKTVSLKDGDGEHEYVAVYASTPYGVTSHLHVPVYREKEASEDAAQKAVAEATAALTARVDTIAKATTGYRWDTPAKLPIVHSYKEDPAIPNSFQRCCYGLGDISVDVKYTLSWDKIPAAPAGAANKAGLMAVISLNGKDVSTPFWIGTGFDIDLATGKLTLTSQQLAAALLDAITQHLKMDRTGDLDVVQISLKTWIAPAVSAIDQQGQPTFASVGSPIATDQQISIELIRRTDPAQEKLRVEGVILSQGAPPTPPSISSAASTGSIASDLENRDLDANLTLSSRSVGRPPRVADFSAIERPGSSRRNATVR